MKVITFVNERRALPLFKVFIFFQELPSVDVHLSMLSFFSRTNIVAAVGDMRADFNSLHLWLAALIDYLSREGIETFEQHVGSRRYPDLSSIEGTSWMVGWLRSLDPGFGPTEDDRVVGNWSHVGIRLEWESLARRDARQQREPGNDGSRYRILTFQQVGPPGRWTYRVHCFFPTNNHTELLQRMIFALPSDNLGRELHLPKLVEDGLRPTLEPDRWWYELWSALTRQGFHFTTQDCATELDAHLYTDDLRVQFLDHALSAQWAGGTGLVLTDYSSPHLLYAWNLAHPPITTSVSVGDYTYRVEVDRGMDDTHWSLRRVPQESLDNQVARLYSEGRQEEIMDALQRAAARQRGAMRDAADSMRNLAEVTARISVEGMDKLRARLDEAKAILERQEAEAQAERQAEMERQDAEAKRPPSRSSAIELYDRGGT